MIDQMIHVETDTTKDGIGIEHIQKLPSLARDMDEVETDTKKEGVE